MKAFSERKFLEGLSHSGISSKTLIPSSIAACRAACIISLGLHAKGRLLRVMQGAAFDVVADIRRELLTQGQGFGVEFSACNSKQLWPSSGFLALEDERHSLCQMTDCCTPQAERAIVWNDATIVAVWPDLAALVPRLLQKMPAAPTMAKAELV